MHQLLYADDAPLEKEPRGPSALQRLRTFPQAPRRRSPALAKDGRDQEAQQRKRKLGTRVGSIDSGGQKDDCPKELYRVQLDNDAGGAAGQEPPGIRVTAVGTVVGQHAYKRGDGRKDDGHPDRSRTAKGIRHESADRCCAETATATFAEPERADTGGG